MLSLVPSCKLGVLPGSCRMAALSVEYSLCSRLTGAPRGKAHPSSHSQTLAKGMSIPAALKMMYVRWICTIYSHVWCPTLLPEALHVI